MGTSANNFVKLYSEYYQKYLFVSSDRDTYNGYTYYTLEAHPGNDDSRGIFTARKDPNSWGVRIYNDYYAPETWVFVTHDDDGGDKIVQASSTAANDDRGLFYVYEENDGVSARFCNFYYSQRWLFPSAYKKGDDNVVEAHTNDADRRNVLRVEFIEANYEITNVQYDMSQLTKVEIPPLMMGHQTARNHSNVEQSQTLHFHKGESVNRSLSHTVGITVGASVTFKAGVPLIAEGEVTVSTEISTEFTWGEDITKSIEVEYEFPVNVPPNSTVVGTAKFKQGQITVPYTADCKATFPDGKSVTYEIQGIYSGINAYDAEGTWEQPQSQSLVSV